jgi:5-deoxy-glucuronate isomerase
MSLVVRGAVTPESAGWSYVGFEAATGPLGRATGATELCVVVIAGTCTVRSRYGDWDVGGRPDPWSGPPDAVYLPPGTDYEIEGDAEVGLCTAPASAGAPARVLPGDAIVVETRGHGAHERTIRPILMDDEAADSLLVCEVLTPPGHWSSYPPHKHDREAMPAESCLEETYYYRISPPQGFALQRVYTKDGALDETLAVGDGDVVLVPRGYHTVSAPPGYDVYYLNVMAGPVRAWAVANDPDHEWTLTP